MVGKKSRFAAALALLVLPALAYAAGPVTMKGRLAGTQKLLNPVWNEAKDPASHSYSFREPSVTTRVEARTLTAQLDREVAIVAIHDAGAVVPGTMNLIGGRAVPTTLVVSQGQSVQIVNKDPFPHRIYDTGNKGLQVGETPSTKARTWLPPAAGKYEIRDQAAPSLRAWIVVEPKAVAVTYPDRKGEFAIELAPGKYKLRAYHNGEMVGKELEIAVNTAPLEQLLKAPLVVADEPKKDQKK